MTKWYTRWCGCAFLSQSFCSTINFRFTRLWRKRVIFCYSIVIANKIYMYYIFSKKKTMAKQQLSWQLNKQRIASWYKSLITGLKNGLPDQLNKSLSSVCYILHYFLHCYNVGIVKLKKNRKIQISFETHKTFCHMEFPNDTKWLILYIVRRRPYCILFPQMLVHRRALW